MTTTTAHFDVPSLAAATTTTPMLTLTTCTAIGCGVMGGVFFAFSTFVMPALDKLAPRDSISAMQAINKAAPNAVFMTALFGTAVACVVVGVSAMRRWGTAGANYQLIGCGLYLVAIVLTAAYHVPHNDALAKVDPRSLDVLGAARRWTTYARGWTLWNHVRTVTPIAAAAFLTLAVRSAD